MVGPGRTRVAIQNVDQPGKTRAVDAEHYDAVRTTLLAILPEDPPGMTLRGLLPVCALLGLAVPVTAQDSPFTLERLAPGVYAAIDVDARAGANAGFVIGDEGVAIIDSFQYPEAAERLLIEIRKLTALPVRYVINTHHHIDHVAGNGVLKDAGALTVAHRNVMEWLRTENLKFYEPEQSEERALVERLPLPDVLVDDQLTIRLGARRLELCALPGHSGGDLVVAVPDAQVLFAGDLFWRQVAPSLIDATVSTWIETLEGLRARPDAAALTWVPGQGGIAISADVADFEQYLRYLSATVGTAVGSGATGDDLVALALPSLRARYGGWQFFDDLAPQQIPLMAAELAGTKRLPDAAPNAVAEAQAPGSSRDQTDIHALWAAVDDAWDRREAERFSDLFAESASLWFVDRGERIETRARILDRFIGQFADQSPDLRHTTRIDTVHALSGGLVGIDGEVLIQRLAPDGRGARTPVRRFAVTGVMEHDAAGWRIRVLRAFQIWPGTAGEDSGE